MSIQASDVFSLIDGIAEKLTDKERKSLFFFLSNGRVAIAYTGLFSLFPVLFLSFRIYDDFPDLSLWEILCCVFAIFWGICWLVALVYTSPVIYHCVLNAFRTCFPRFRSPDRKDEEVSQMFGALLLGDDRFLKKAGRRVALKISKPEDLIADSIQNKSRVVEEIKKSFDLFRNDERSNRGVYFRAFFDKLLRDKVIKESTSEQWNKFCQKLGRDYLCSEKNLRNSGGKFKDQGLVDSEYERFKAEKDKIEASSKK